MKLQLTVNLQILETSLGRNVDSHLTCTVSRACCVSLDLGALKFESSVESSLSTHHASDTFL